MQKMKFKSGWCIVLMFLAGFAMTLSSCELLEEDEFCNYSRNDTRLWLPERDVIEYYNDGGNIYVGFLVSLSSDIAEATFRISNVCPTSFFNVTVTVREKYGSSSGKPNYKFVIWVKDGKANKVLRAADLYYLSDYQQQRQITETLLSFEEGPAEFYISIQANWPADRFGSEAEARQWTRDEIQDITIQVDYTGWE